MKEIQLTRGKVALVDDEDFELLSQNKWYAQKYSKTDTWYAARRIWKVDGNKDKTILMHIQIMGTKPGFEIDHKDTNGLNNQKPNLRYCTSSQNQMNTKKRKGCTSKYKGIYWDNQMKSWRVRVKKDGKIMYQKLFKDEISAAIAYNNAAIIHFGDFARLNIIPDLHQTHLI